MLLWCLQADQFISYECLRTSFLSYLRELTTRNELSYYKIYYRNAARVSRRQCNAAIFRNHLTKVTTLKLITNSISQNNMESIYRFM